MRMIKDRKRAKLVGEITFCKGIVQSLIPFPDGSAIKITTAKYFTPSGVSIHGIGINPDYEVALSPKSEELLKAGNLSEMQDTQLKKGMEILRQEIK